MNRQAVNELVESMQDLLIITDGEDYFQVGLAAERDKSLGFVTFREDKVSEVSIYEEGNTLAQLFATREVRITKLLGGGSF
jgi:hypothetical protein